MNTDELGIEFVCRYLYGHLPDPQTMCIGTCEGTGWVPIHRDRLDLYALDWFAAHARAHTLRTCLRAVWGAEKWSDVRWACREFAACDGWHFCRCVDCGGTGERQEKETR